MNKSISKSLAAKELHLNFWDKLTHYSVVIFLLSVTFIWLLFELTELNKHYVNDLTPFGIGSFIFALAFYYLQRKRLKLIPLRTTLNRDQVIEVANEAAKQRDWRFQEFGKSYAIATHSGGLITGSWGEQITIIIDLPTVWINSICNPKKQTSLISYGQNAKNVNTFKHYLEAYNTHNKE